MIKLNQRQRDSIINYLKLRSNKTVYTCFMLLLVDFCLINKSRLNKYKISKLFKIKYNKIINFDKKFNSYSIDKFIDENMTNIGKKRGYRYNDNDEIKNMIKNIIQSEPPLGKFEWTAKEIKKELNKLNYEISESTIRRLRHLIL